MGPEEWRTSLTKVRCISHTKQGAVAVANLETWPQLINESGHQEMLAFRYRSWDHHCGLLSLKPFKV